MSLITSGQARIDWLQRAVLIRLALQQLEQDISAAFIDHPDTRQAQLLAAADMALGDAARSVQTASDLIAKL